MIPRHAAFLLIAAASYVAPYCRAQEAANAYGSLDELKASYSKKLLDLERQRIADMAALAARQKGAEAEATYRELLRIAVARDLYTEAEPAAKAYLKGDASDPADRAMAVFVGVIAKANRGEYDQSLADLTGFLNQHPPRPDAPPSLETGTAIAIGEAYIERLLRGGRYDIARKVCELAVARRSDPVFNAHFKARLARISMLSKPAPPIAGKDVDGKPVRLADLAGKVVLVDFWATWCPPCVAAIPDLQSLQTRYGKEGFTVLGVNLDARREDVGDVARAAPVVRQFLLNSRISWPNLLIGPPAPGDPASLYGVEEIPANFLIDRKGNIIHIELSGPELDRAIKKAL